MLRWIAITFLAALGLFVWMVLVAPGVPEGPA